MRLNLIHIALIGIFLLSCSSEFVINKDYDESNPDSIIYSTPRLQVKSKYNSKEFYTFLQFTCYKNNNNKTYLISSTYTGKSFPDLEKIIFFVNGNAEEITPERSSVQQIEGVLGRTETISVQVSENLITNLYEENDILMSVIGNDIRYDVQFTNGIKQKLRQFYVEAI